MTLRLGADDAALLDALASVDQMSASDVMRHALADRIAARRRDPAFRARIDRILQEEAEALMRLADGPT